ncbi:MAG: molybdopterin cofactor-binding domain-containing protein [Vicinamibacterales bacterium]
MSSEALLPPLDRRGFLKAGGALVVGVAVGETGAAQPSVPAMRGTQPGPPEPTLIDTWVAVHADNTVTIYIGFAELGQGASTALLQIAAEELDLDMSQLRSVELDTNVTPNQGGTVSSASINRGGPQIRAAAAEARLALLRRAADRLGAPVEQLVVTRGVVSVAADAAKRVTYGELVGDRPFGIPFTGSAPTKKPTEYRIAGQSIPRRDMPDKVRGTYRYVQHVTMPGMLHGRVVRPRGQGAYGDGARVLTVDETSIASIPGARVVRVADFVGVVAERQWDAVRAAQALKVAWHRPASLPGSARVYERMRAERTADRIVVERGTVEDAFASAAHRVSLTCQLPYQAHAPFGPNCAIADVQAGRALVVCSTQDVYGTRTRVARVLGVAPEQVRVQYAEGAGTYGYSCYNDAAQAAAILSKVVGRPVRVQFMRWDEHGWDNYGPAHVGDVRVAADASGRITAYEYHGWQHHWAAVDTSEQLALAVPAAERPGSGAQQVNPLTLGSMYAAAHARIVNHHVPGLRYLKGAFLRSPLDLSQAFTSEQAIDQLAFALGHDPYEFRRMNISDERWLGVLNAVAERAKWAPRRAASSVSAAPVVTGRGIGLGTHLVSYGAAVAEIEVHRDSGVVVAKRLIGAIDAGLAVNPGNIEHQIGGQLVQTASRMFKEEVTFDEAGVTSLDWASYPILRFDESPEVVGICVQRTAERSTGAGEEVMAAAAAAIGNAFFDATGVRMRTFPFTPARVLAAIGDRPASAAE